MSLIYTSERKQDTKDPSEARDYAVEVTNAADGLTVVSATVVVSGLTAATPVCVGTRATARFTGGTADTDYTATFTMTLSDGQIRVDSIIIPVRER